MSDEQILKLVKINEKSVISLLMVNGLVEPIVEQDGLTFDNVRPTVDGKLIIGKTLYFDDTWLKTLRARWPVTMRGGLDELRSKCEKFMAKTSATTTAIDRIVDEWLKERGQYCGKLPNFFYNIDKEGHSVSEAENMLESLTEINEDFRLRQAGE